MNNALVRSKKITKVPRKIKLDSTITEVEVDLKEANLILFSGTNRRGEVIERHLKITEKGKMTLM